MRRINMNVLVFFITLFTLGIACVYPAHRAAVSEYENRQLKSRPKISLNTLLSGKYFKDYDEYFADSFAFRDNLLKMSKAISMLRGISNKDGAEIIIHNGANVAQNNSTQEDTKNDEGHLQEQAKKEATENIPSPKGTVIGKMLILNDSAMEVHNFNKSASIGYADAINRFADKLPESLKIYSMIVPTQIEFLKSDKYKNLSSSQKDTINFINGRFISRITPVDVYDALKDNSEKYVYFRTDHHWTALGAYYGYTSFARYINETPAPLQNYKVQKIENFLGSTYSITLNKKLEKHPDTIYVYEPFIDNQYYIYYQGPMKSSVIDMSHATKKNKYRVFLSGDRPMGKIITQVKNGRKIAVIKDSYGNAFIPFLIPHYEEIYIIDPRQYKGDFFKLIKENNINEVLFLNYVLSADNNDWASLINGMIK